jgi:tRNA threonylcarbamoyladenosine modification (KEOPS) complex  Pcc1 subunit
MDNNKFEISSKIEIKFTDETTRDNSYDSYIPEITQLNRRRTKINIKKGEKSIIFDIEASDFTAFRAAVSDIINFGKIMEKELELIK